MQDPLDICTCLGVDLHRRSNRMKLTREIEDAYLLGIKFCVSLFCISYLSWNLQKTINIRILD